MTETAEQIQNRRTAKIYSGGAADETITPDNAIWNLEQIDLERLAPLYSGGAKAWLDEEIEIQTEITGFEPHWCNFLKAENLLQHLDETCDDPCVIAIDQDENIQIWDGWHRIACAIVKGEKSMDIIVGRVMEPVSAPRL